MAKERIKNIAAGMGCLILWVVFEGLNISHLWSAKDFMLTFLGAGILTIPHITEIRNEKQKAALSAYIQTFVRQMPISGYLASFILVFAKITEPEKITDITLTITLCLRPAIYGFVLYMCTYGVNLKGSDIKSGDNDSVTKKGTRKITVELLRNMGLTVREAEIAQMINRRMTNREIAEELYISEATVKKHVSHIFEKLGIGCREEIAKVCLQAVKSAEDDTD